MTEHLLPFAGRDASNAMETMTDLQRGKIEALNCIHEWLKYAYHDGNTPSYRAALDDMLIHVEAALERARDRQPLNTVSDVD